jgi:hypothetical protein
MTKLLQVTSRAFADLNRSQLLAVLFLILAKAMVAVSIGLFMVGLARPSYIGHSSCTLTAAGIFLMLCVYFGVCDWLSAQKHGR